MEYLALVCILFSSALGYAPLREQTVQGVYTDAAFIQDLMERINRDMEPETSYVDFGGNKMDHASGFAGAFVPGRSTKDSEFFDENDYDSLLGSSGHPSIRDQEYLQHSSLYGHKYMTGGTGESGVLKMEGQKTPSEVKSDAILPAYCNPPNPCPVGHTTEDGCLESFENTAAFSRVYQGSQDCMCDTEHMFDCHASQESDENDMTPNILMNSQSQFLSDLQGPEQTLSRLNEMARNAAAAAHDSGIKLDENPYLQGEKLPIAAKKGHHAL